MPLDHVDQLIDVAAWHNNIANFFLWLHLLPHHEQVGPVLADHTRIDRFFGVFLDLLSQLLRKLKQFLVFLHGFEAFI